MKGVRKEAHPYFLYNVTMLYSLLFPRRCVSCRKAGEGYLCDGCFQSIHFNETQYCPAVDCDKASLNGITHEGCQRKYDLDGHLSLTEYDDIMRSIIEFYKRRKVTKLESDLKDIIAYYFTEPESPFPFSLTQKPVVAAVPLFWIDQRLRGFNTAEQIGNLIARSLELSFSNQVLKKAKPTRSQKKLSKKERSQNIQGSFEVVQNNMVDGKEFVIVDDIWTTGSTLRECARVLKKAGASQVWGITLTKGI